MNDFAKRWLAALRSGKFEQGRGALCYNDKYCCLGVACELYRREVGIEISVRYTGRLTYFGESIVLPIQVQTAIGLRTSSGVYSHGYKSLALHNDKGMSFAEIADLIESRPPELFA